MIPRLVRLIFVLPCVIALGGCAQLTINGNIAATMLLIPIYLDDGGMMNRAGTTYYDSRWYADPDSHPAVRPPRKPPEAAGAAGPASRGSSTAAP
jgi:hypothetical protein